MAILNNTWYCNGGNGTSTGYYAVGVWQSLHAYTAGTFVRQVSPAVNSERLFVCIIAGTSLAAEPTWVLTQGAKTAEAAGPTWQECTGKPGPCGDLTNSQTTATTRSKAITLGEVIYDSGSSSLQICSTAGTSGSGTPSFSATAGTTTADTGATWTSLGNISNYTTVWKYPWARTNLGLASGFFVTSTIDSTVYVSNNHAATQSTAVADSNYGNNNLLKIICVNDAAAPPTTLATTASITTTGASNIVFGATATANIYVYGLNFTGGDGANASSMNFTGQYENCTFTVGNTNTGSSIQGQGNNIYGCIMTNCNFVLGATGQALWNVNSTTQDATIKGGTMFATGSIPTIAFKPQSNKTCRLIIQDVDLSAVTGTLVGTNVFGAGTVNFRNCKLGAGVAATTGVWMTKIRDPYIQIHNADSGGTNYRYDFESVLGSVQQETSIVRSGSLSTNGVTPISWNNTTTSSDVSTFNPIFTEEIAQWNENTGVLNTLTFYLISSATLDNSLAWIEVEYPSSSGSPIGSLISTRVAPLATPVALTSDASVWGGSPPANGYKIVTTFTPGMKGLVKLRFYSAKVSTTIYIDPYIYLS